MRLRAPLVLFALLFGQAVAASPSQLGWVTAVTPSNSLIIQFQDGQTLQVVLAYLSIPYGGQAYADRAGQVLRAQLLDRQVNVRQVGRQTDGFLSALVYFRGNNFNADFLERGHAWVNHLANPPPQWRRIEAGAQSARRGLWATEGPQHPIDYHYSKKRAELFTNGMAYVQADPYTPDYFARALVADRKTKKYYPFQCITWTTIPRRHISIFTSVRGAEHAGYTEAPCE